MFNDPGENINPKPNDLWKPVIAAVNGMACGGALYMLGEVDIIIAAEHATFFDPHVTYGMVAGFESMHMLQKMPLGETMRVALLGARERMSRERAHQLGLVSEVVPADELLERALWVADAIASAPVLAIQGTLRAVWMAHEVARRQALDQVSTWVSLGTEYDNIESGQQAFQGRRTASGDSADGAARRPRGALIVAGHGPSFAIIGGGIGGAAAALSLHEIGRASATCGP